jgi:hypothetical protein
MELELVKQEDSCDAHAIGDRAVTAPADGKVGADSGREAGVSVDYSASDSEVLELDVEIGEAMTELPEELGPPSPAGASAGQAVASAASAAFPSGGAERGAPLLLVESGACPL